jgi:adenylate cyclase class IV
MADEIELKAPVPDPSLLRGRLRAAGAVLVREGMMSDRRFDDRGRLAAVDHVLRVRAYALADGRADGRVTWKGPTRVTAEGYKLREEHELRFDGDSAAAGRILAALGFDVSYAIDRWVEYWSLDGATLRLEWYPRMDVLLEVEGEPAAIERAVAATGLPRDLFTAEALADFVAGYERRTGRRAAVSLHDLGEGEVPTWTSR